MIEAALPRIEIDGRPATAADLLPALGGYGHFTAMQVRDRKTRGMDFHLARLDAANRELYGSGLDADRLRELLQHALADDITDASLRVNVFTPAIGAEASVMVSIRPPAPVNGTPRSLKSVPHQRLLAHTKHTGGFDQAHYMTLVAKDGFDEGLFVAPNGVVAEGTITNIGFIDGDTVVWPDAPALHGVAMQVIERELERAGRTQQRRPVHLADVHAFDGAFVSNSQGVAPVARIDDVVLPASAERVADVMRLFAAAPWDTI